MSLSSLHVDHVKVAVPGCFGALDGQAEFRAHPVSWCRGLGVGMPLVSAYVSNVVRLLLVQVLFSGGPHTRVPWMDEVPTRPVFTQLVLASSHLAVEEARVAGTQQAVAAQVVARHVAAGPRIPLSASNSGAGGSFPAAWSRIW